MLPETLDAMWWSGFCDETIRYASGTPQPPDGKHRRLVWAEKHMPTCQECTRANKLKGLEEKVAKAIGREEDFHAGRDFTTVPGYAGALDKVLRAAVVRGLLKPVDLAWMARMATRHGKPWPGHEERTER